MSAEPQVINPTVITLLRTAPIEVIVVGAGGIGARIIPALAKMLREGDGIHVYDDDRVEEYNLTRQHFCRDDVGTHKSEVMQSRYYTDRVPIVAHTVKLTPDTLPPRQAGTGIAPGGQLLHIILGGVDSRAARGVVRSWYIHRLEGPRIYIDGGNDRRSGQVLMGFRSAYAQVLGRAGRITANLDIKLMMPQVFDGAEDDETAGCGVRVDIQTVNVNNTCAALMLNALSFILAELPMSACGWIFSTFNSIQQIPIMPMSDVDAAMGVLNPSRIFAARPPTGATTSPTIAA